MSKKWEGSKAKFEKNIRLEPGKITPETENRDLFNLPKELVRNPLTKRKFNLEKNIHHGQPSSKSKRKETEVRFLKISDRFIILRYQ